MLKRKLFSAILIFSCITLISQTRENRFERFTENDGLSQSTVKTIMQDNFGYLWIGTGYGLDKYDGYEFQNFQHSKQDSLSISDSYIRTIYQDKDNSIWIGTRNGLNRINFFDNLANDKICFQHFLYDSSNTSSISNNNIEAIYQDHSGQIWIGTTHGLNKLDIENTKKETSFKFVRYFNDPYNPETISSNRISSLIEDNYGNLWIGTLGGGLNKLNLKTNKISHYFNEGSPSYSHYIITLFVDHNGTLWMGTYGGGLIKFNPENELFKVYKNDSGINSLSNNHVFSIKEDRDGFLWIGTFGGGINKFDPVNEMFHSYNHIATEPNSLNSDLIYSVFIDNSNNLWAGSDKGLNKLDLKPIKFFHYKNSPHDSNSIQDNFVNSLVEDHTGNLWIATNKGLDKIDHLTKDYTHYDLNKGKGSNRFILSDLYTDSRGNLWIGSFGDGLFKFNKSTQKFEQFVHNPENSKSILDDRITEIFEINNGYLLIGTHIGICKMNIKTGEFFPYIFDLNDSRILEGIDITNIYKDKEDILWIATREGLFSLDCNSRKWEKYIHNNNDTNSISPSDVNSVIEDKNGIIWIGTKYGLDKFDRAQSRFVHYTKKDGLPSNLVTNILADAEGNLWITAGKYISKFSGQRFRNFGANDGIKAFSFNADAKFKSKRGKIYFGGANGYIKFSPQSIKDNPYPPQVVITRFKKYEEVKKSSLQLLNTNEIHLAYDDNFFSFEFAALDFTRPVENQYACKLEGLEDHWNYIGTRNYVSYTNLDPGKYIFRVKASNNDGVWNDKGRALTIIIPPPFWQTGWFGVLAGLIMTGMIFMLYKKRIYNLEKERTAHEEFSRSLIRSQENERRRIASELHDSLGQNLLIIKNRALMGMKAKTDNMQCEQLKEISLAASTAITEVRRTSYDLHPYQLERLGLTKTIRSILNNIDNSCEINFNESLDDIDGLLSKENEINVYRIVQECINNIVKHSEADSADVKIKKNEKNIRIDIVDYGKGFDINSIHAEHDPAKGFGIRNISRRVNIVNGTLKINSSVNVGTYINITIPLD